MPDVPNSPNSPSSGSSKNQRRAEAREAARKLREKEQKRARLRRWAIPTAVTVALVAIVTVVVIVIINSVPAPLSTAGPRNMASDGILFVGEDGAAVPVETGAIPASGTPTPNDLPDGVVHIQEYIDFSCPACKLFEERYASSLIDLVEAGTATLEVYPISILNDRFQGTHYSTRAGNVGACVADVAPDSFLDVKAALFAGQPEEGTSGLTNAQLVSLVHDAGLTDATVDACITDETFAGWVDAATDRATSNSALFKDDGSFSTPTIVVDGKVWQNQGDFQDFLDSAVAG